MIRRIALMLLALLTVVVCLLSVDASAQGPSVRRFALLVGANDGGSERPVLRYAASDAELFGKALTELGGLDSRDRTLLVDPKVAALEQAFRTIAAQAKAARSAGARVEFFFFYSGHGDESGLLLAGVRVDYKRLRELIDSVDADVRVGVLDSCSSGAFTRLKGGKKHAPFVPEPPERGKRSEAPSSARVDGSGAEVRGHAYLSSSAADEAAQESDRIGGSFFTHFLVTGLRGAADFDGDRKVTLGEAYRYAFDETLARTETTTGGPQHAAYDIRLAGAGELVITDLRKTSATLEIAADVSGRLYIRDRRGKLAAELAKPKHAGVVTLALEPGDYTITIDDGRDLHRATVVVRTHKTAVLGAPQLEGVVLEGTRLRGAEPLSKVRVPFNLGLAPRVEINAAFGPAPILNNVSLSMLATGAAGVEGLQAALGAVWVSDSLRGLQTALGASWTSGHMRGLQSTLLFNYAGRLTGVQLGAVNLAKASRGAQLGLVNVSKGRVEGVQIGVINYAEEADASIGLVPITKRGGVWFNAWTSDVQLIHAAVKFRARRTYSFLTAGIHPLGPDGAKSWSGGLGLGAPLLSRRRLGLELDSALSLVNSGYAITRAPRLLDTLRLALALRPARRFAVWGAVTGNLLLDFDQSDDERTRPGYRWSWELAGPSAASPGLQIWPGFALGFEI